MNKMKGFKTVIFNVIMAVIMVIYAFNPDAERPSAEQVSSTIDMVLTGLAAVWAIGNVILRAISTAPIFNGLFKKDVEEQDYDDDE